MRIIALVAFVSLAGLTVLATAASAGEGCGYDEFSVVEHIFDAADADRDGNLTPDEYAAAGLEGYGVSFEESDANGDGLTSLAEYVQLYGRHHPPGDRLGA